MAISTRKAIYDTTDGVVHKPYDYGTYGDDDLEGIDEFVAWLNAKARNKRGAEEGDRFTVVTVTPIARTGRGGMARQYTEYLKGEPEMRVRAAIRHVIRSAYQNRREYPASIVQQGGGWAVPDATATIRTIAEIANVPFNDAHAAFHAYLRNQLGDVMDRVMFPPADAVRPEDDVTDRHGDESHPLDL